jgi:hypothetical protein
MIRSLNVPKNLRLSSGFVSKGPWIPCCNTSSTVGFFKQIISINEAITMYDLPSENVPLQKRYAVTHD